MSKDLLVALALIVFTGTCHAGGVTCLRNTKIDITDVFGKFNISGDPKPKNFIALRMVVDCKSDRALKPATEDQALDWLDMTLPLDFKSAALYGEYVNTARYGLYGISVEEDVSKEITRAWNLRGNELCKAIENSSPQIKQESSCFYKLLYKLRERYKTPASVQ